MTNFPEDIMDIIMTKRSNIMIMNKIKNKPSVVSQNIKNLKIMNMQTYQTRLDGTGGGGCMMLDDYIDNTWHTGRNFSQNYFSIYQGQKDWNTEEEGDSSYCPYLDDADHIDLEFYKDTFDKLNKLIQID